MIVGVSGTFGLPQVRHSCVATLLLVHLFNLVIRGVQAGVADGDLARIVLRSQNGALLVATLCQVLGLAQEVRMSDVHLSAGHPWCFDRIDCQLWHSVLVKRDLLTLNEVLFQAPEFSLTFHSLPLVLLDILFVLGALQVEKLAVEVL